MTRAVEGVRQEARASLDYSQGTFAATSSQWRVDSGAQLIVDKALRRSIAGGCCGRACGGAARCCSLLLLGAVRQRAGRRPAWVHA